jgi:hypothetical protein
MATGRIGTTPVLQVRWSKAPADGTTSLSGLDDNSVSLVYSVGYEAVYRNGVLLSRGNDYTATDGTTVTLIDATITGDIIEIFANQTIPLSDTYSQTVSDGKFINNTLTTTTGDIIYASGANTPARLAIGTSADVLTVSGGIPAWAAPAGGGKVLQVVSATTSTGVATGTATYIDTNLTASITPAAATSKVLVLFHQNGVYRSAAGNTSGVSLRLMRGATEIMVPAQDWGYTNLSQIFLGGTISGAYLDSPATTSATTYKTQFKPGASTFTASVQESSSVSVITLLEIGA